MLLLLLLMPMLTCLAGLRDTWPSPSSRLVVGAQPNRIFLARQGDWILVSPHAVFFCQEFSRSLAVAGFSCLPERVISDAISSRVKRVV